MARTLPAAPGPSPSDLVSFTTLRSFLEKTQGAAGPEAHLRARYIPNPDGSVGARRAPDRAIRQAMSKEMQAAYKSYNPDRIIVPAVVIMPHPNSPLT